jgi:uncharacterized protein involved in exopolysaccharide biosynthesis
MDGQNLQSNTYRPEQVPTLRGIAKPHFRHRKLVLLTFLSLVLGAILGIILLPKDYEAKMKILVKSDRVDAAVSLGRDAALANPRVVTDLDPSLRTQMSFLKLCESTSWKPC